MTPVAVGISLRMNNEGDEPALESNQYTISIQQTIIAKIFR